MATELAQNMTSVEGDIPKGSVRIVVSELTSPPAFPTKLEDIIGTDRTNATTFMKLKTGYRDIGRTTTDGATLGTSFDRTEGIETDQDDEPIGGGDPTNLARTMQFTMLELNEKNLRLAYALPDPTTIAAVAATNVEQLVQEIRGLDNLDEQQVILLQMHPTTKVLHAWAYRRAQLQEVGDLQLSKNPNGLQVTLQLKKDLTANSYGKRFRTAAAL
jgi:hypothetical protein